MLRSFQDKFRRGLALFKVDDGRSSDPLQDDKVREAKVAQNGFDSELRSFAG